MSAPRNLKVSKCWRQGLPTLLGENSGTIAIVVEVLVVMCVHLWLTGFANGLVKIGDCGNGGNS